MSALARAMSEAVRGYQVAHPEVDWDTHVVQLRRVGDIEIGGVEWVDGSRLPHAPVVKLEDVPCPWTTSFRGASLPCSGRAGHPGQCFSYVERRWQRDVTP